MIFIFWPAIKNTWFYRHIGYHDLLKRFFLLNTHLFRSRIRLQEYLSLRILDRWRKLLLSRETAVRVRWFDTPEKGRPQFTLPQGPEEDRKRPDFNISDSEIRARLATFKEVYPLIHQRLAKENIKIMWVWMPLAFS